MTKKRRRPIHLHVMVSEEELALLNACDVLIDGPFLQAERSLELRWRGSRNQRLIDLNATRRTGKLTLLTE